MQTATYQELEDSLLQDPAVLPSMQEMLRDAMRRSYERVRLAHGLAPSVQDNIITSEPFTKGLATKAPVQVDMAGKNLFSVDNW